MTIKPYQLNVLQSVLDDLKKRLSSTRFPDEVGADWNQGSSIAYIKELAAYWQNKFDWRAQEAKLNEFNWFSANIDGVEMRFIHARGKGANPTPIILFHGWPDSVLRYLKLIPQLTDPAKYGGDANDSFDVVVPYLIDSSDGSVVSIREYMFKQTAERWWKLMTQELGYQRFVAAGGDQGSPLSQLLAVDHPDSLIGIHLTDIGFNATMGEHENLSEVEQEYLNSLQWIGFQEGAYSMVQGTKPQTLAFGLNDSPVGLAAWIVEKFRSWSDCDGDIEKLYTKDELLTNIMFYWTGHFDPRGYREEFTAPSLSSTQQIVVPTALAQPPKDIITPITPREFAERNLKNLQRFTILPQGGHFVAMEYPQLVADDIRAFVRLLR